ncbi:MAG: T9SS type A sorting domain-containing protein, partial [Saprospiraceae bacterium]|nr:T9SS type A sorting domain-containing protein [Saprospiraceae bacterium]
AQSVAVESLGFDQLAICGSLTDLYGFSDDGYLALFEEDVSTEPDFSDNFPEGSSAAAMLRDVDGCLVMAGRSSEGFYFRKNCMDVVNTETARIPASGAFVFPQPGDDHVAVGALEPERLPADFRLFNTKGQLVRQGQLIQTEQIISTIDLPTGHYVLQLLYKDEVVQRLPVLITH